MDSHGRTPNQSVSPEQYVSNDGWALIWINTILLVPAIFGVMFLPSILRLLVFSLGIGLTVTFVLVYGWARVHPASSVAHVLDVLHIGPPRQRITH